MARAINEKEEFKKCTYCELYSKGGCRSKHCAYLLERALLGTIKYKDIIKDFWSEHSEYYFRKRLKSMTRSFTGEFFLSPYHKDRYTHLKESGAPVRKTKRQYLAAIYLLASDEDLWNRAKDHIYRKEICFADMKLKGISTNGYAIYQAAKSMYNENAGVTISELADPTLISETTFKAIIIAQMMSELSDKLLQTKQ